MLLWTWETCKSSTFPQHAQKNPATQTLQKKIKIIIIKKSVKRTERLNVGFPISLNSYTQKDNLQNISWSPSLIINNQNMRWKFAKNRGKKSFLCGYEEMGMITRRGAELKLPPQSPHSVEKITWNHSIKYTPHEERLKHLRTRHLAQMQTYKTIRKI